MLHAGQQCWRHVNEGTYLKGVIEGWCSPAGEGSQVTPSGQKRSNASISSCFYYFEVVGWPIACGDETVQGMRGAGKFVLAR